MKNAITSELLAPNQPQTDAKSNLERVTDDLLNSLRVPEQLSPDERRGIIARYGAVLEGNFIYWMTGAYIAARSREARSIIMENLYEEVRDSHPLMLRKFTMAARAQPTDADAMAINENLSKVRLFIGRLEPVPILATMAFFESFIQRFMPYLEELAVRQGSSEIEYTQVHGVCDIAHSEGLFRGLQAEMVLAPNPGELVDFVYEGVDLLRALMENVFTGRSAAAAA